MQSVSDWLNTATPDTNVKQHMAVRCSRKKRGRWWLRVAEYSQTLTPPRPSPAQKHSIPLPVLEQGLRPKSDTFHSTLPVARHALFTRVWQHLATAFTRKATPQDTHAGTQNTSTAIHFRHRAKSKRSRASSSPVRQPRRHTSQSVPLFVFVQIVQHTREGLGC